MLDCCCCENFVWLWCFGSVILCLCLCIFSSGLVFWCVCVLWNWNWSMFENVVRILVVILMWNVGFGVYCVIELILMVDLVEYFGFLIFRSGSFWYCSGGRFWVVLYCCGFKEFEEKYGVMMKLWDCLWYCESFGVIWGGCGGRINCGGGFENVMYVWWFMYL